MSIGLFTGIETANWQLADFGKLADFCKVNGVDTVVLKIWEITQGEWYKNIGGPDTPIDLLKNEGLTVLPYGYFYGDSPQPEIDAILHYLNRYGVFCVDAEGSFNNNTKIDLFIPELENHPGTLYLSTWANPVTQGWSTNIGKLDPVVDVWMPQVYSDFLVKEMYSQFPKVQGKIEPTFHVINTDYRAASIYPTLTLWEYQLAQNDTQALRNYVSQNEGKVVTSYPTNSRGMIAEFVPVSQFQPGRSEFECGAFAVALNMRSTNANTPNTYDLTKLVAWAEAEYAKYTGSNGPANNAGVSIGDMHGMLKDTQSDPNPASHLHWWDIVSITPGSTQEHDIAEIKAALQHGYPVIATVSEASVYDYDLGKNPYWWGPSGNHIITYVGIGANGELLAVDPANVIEGDGNLQTPKQVQPWPRRYDISRIDNQWCTIIGHSWLPPIPSGDPFSWPPYQPPTPPPPPPQNQAVTLMYDPVGKQLLYIANNIVVYRQPIG